MRAITSSSCYCFSRSWFDSRVLVKPRRIPRTESWIVQGAIGTDGLPVKLDARFKSGSFFDISHANLVFRHFRVSAQVAPLDVDSGHRTYSTRILPGDPTARIGGALHCKQDDTSAACLPSDFLMSIRLTDSRSMQMREDTAASLSSNTWFMCVR